MRPAFANPLLSLLLLVTFFWGGCISCEQYFMFGGATGCCSPHGHCKTKTSPSQNPARECKQIAFDHEKPLDFQITLPAVALLKVAAPVCAFRTLEQGRIFNATEPSPPDLQILHSTFLI